MVGIHRVTIYGFCIVSLVSVIGSMNQPGPVEKNYQDKREAPNQNEIKKMYAVRMGKRSQNQKDMTRFMVRMGKRSQDKLQTQNSVWSRI